MQLIGIYLRKKDPVVTKNLEDGWYPFGNYPAPKDNLSEKRNRIKYLIYNDYYYNYGK